MGAGEARRCGSFSRFVRERRQRGRGRRRTSQSKASVAGMPLATSSSKGRALTMLGRAAEIVIDGVLGRGVDMPKSLNVVLGFLIFATAVVSARLVEAGIDRSALL